MSLNETSSKINLTTEIESFNTKISDAGTYSLCGLTSILFHQLFNEESNRNFCEETVTALLVHLGLSSNQVKNSMFALIDGEGGNIDDFVNLLKNEDALKSSCVPLIESLILFSIRNGNYDARTRVLILKLAELFKIPHALVSFHEESVIEMLSSELPVQSDDQIKEKAKRVRNKKIKRFFMIGLVSLSGGAILGLTGFAAGAGFAASAGALIGSTSAAVLGSTTGIAIISSLFGAAGAGLAGVKMKKRVGDIEEFAFDVLNEGKELHVTIAISGWVSEKGSQAFKTPWNCLQNTREQYCVRYESNYLLELGRALEYFLGFAVSVAAQEALKFTILSGIMAAIAWPATLVTFANVIDNPWGVCIRRSAEVGKHLAEVLLNREQGNRPVSLIGFSLGARVIFFCLLELANRQGSEGIIQDAILLGAPVSGSLEHWRKFSKVVSGRIVNGYCRGDWLLKFLYRTSTASIKIAGLDSIDLLDRRMENIDLSDIVNGHLDYYKKLSSVLKKVKIQVNDNDLKNKSLIKKSATGIPTKEELDEISNLNEKILPSIRMSISDPCLAETIQHDKNKNVLQRSSSLESLRAFKKSSKLVSSFTCTDFKKISNININKNSKIINKLNIINDEKIEKNESKSSLSEAYCSDKLKTNNLIENSINEFSSEKLNLEKSVNLIENHKIDKTTQVFEIENSLEKSKLENCLKDIDKVNDKKPDLLQLDVISLDEKFNEDAINT